MKNTFGHFIFDLDEFFPIKWALNDYKVRACLCIKQVRPMKTVINHPNWKNMSKTNIYKRIKTNIIKGSTKLS